MAYNRATENAASEINRKFDLQVEEIALSPDGNYAYFTAGDRGRLPVFRVPLGGAEPQKMVQDVSATGLQITPDGKIAGFREQLDGRCRPKFIAPTSIAAQ